MTNTKKLPVLSVVFSFFNEAEVLEELIHRTRHALSAEKEKGSLRDFELIFVNDRSTDRSLDILCELRGQSPDIKIINMSRNFGVSPCVLAGMKAAGGDLIVYMDADLQDPPELIPELIAAWRNGKDIDVVHTVRTSRLGEPKVKMLITKIGYQILHRVSSLRLPIETGDFKLLTRKAVTHLIAFREKRPFIRGLVCWIGFNQARVEYVRPPRAAGQAKFSVFGWKVISNFLESALVSFSSMPLQVASVFGMILFSAAVCLWIIMAIGIFAGFTCGLFWKIVSVVLFVGSLQLFSIGVIGLYLTNIFEETKKRPNYIVDSVIGFSENLRDQLNSFS